MYNPIVTHDCGLMAAIPDNIRTELGDLYDFERELVGGGMARVFLAVDRELHRRVVDKSSAAGDGAGSIGEALSQ